MPRRHAIAVVFLLAFMPGASCSSGGSEADGSVFDAATPDSSIHTDAELTDDSGTDDDGDGHVADQGDASLDAASDSGTAVDAGGCATGCLSADPCMPSDCNPITGLCEVSRLPDGAACGEDETDTFICVGAQCVMRGCGDGFREPGTELWPREGCDDGNDVEADTCSLACAPTEFVAQVDPGPEEFDITLAEYGQMLVVDGLGNGLLVWVQHHFGIGESREELRASRIDPQGNFLDVTAPLMLDATTVSGFDMTPSAVGLSTGGFVVAWTATRLVSGVPEFVIVMRRIAPDGTLATEQRVHPAMDVSQRWPRLAALTDSYVIVWQGTGADPDIWGRRFRNNGAAMTTVMALASSNAGRQLKPSVAAQGNAWMVTFLSQAGNISSPIQLRGRRFLESGPLGNDFGILPDHVSTQQVTALQDDYLVVYTTREFDNQGDLYSMTLPRDSGALGTPLSLDSTPMAGVAHPHVAAYGPREQGGYLVVYHDNEVSPNPRFVTVNITPPSEVNTLRMVMRGEDWPAVAAAPYALTGGSVWMAYTAQLGGSRVGAVVFQLPPP
jgi:cysteine-rich repeat protein